MKLIQAGLTFLRRFNTLFSFLLVLLLGLVCAKNLLVRLPYQVGLPYTYKPELPAVSPPSKAPTPMPGASAPSLTDDDSVRISMGLDEKPTWGSTFSYWTSSWAGQTDLKASTPFGPYYRPLSSQLWWLERHFAGPNSLFVFLIIHLLWHLAFTVALWALLRVWWSNQGALLCIACWATGIAFLFNLYATPFEALTMWKDDPEMTVGLCVLGVMAATRAYVLTNRKHWVLLGLMTFALSLSFKESGYVSPFFVVFALWRFKATKQQWRIAPLFFVAAVLAFAYRTWALQGLGGHHGGNGGWWLRAMNELGGGTILGSSYAGRSLPLALAALILGGLHWWLAKRKIAWFWFAVSAFSLFWAEWNVDQWGNAIIQFCDLSLQNFIYMMTPTYIFILLVWQMFVLCRPRPMVWGYIWVLLSYVALMKQVVTAHGFYFLSVGWAIWCAGAIAWVYSEGHQWWNSEKSQTALRETYSRINAVVRRPKASGTTG